MKEQKESKGLIEVKEVTFNNSTLLAIKTDDGKVYASVNNFCNELGVDFSGQLQKLKKHRVLKKRIGDISIPTKGGMQDISCIEVKSIALWLATISPSKIKEEMQERFEVFLERAEETLAKEFLGPQETKKEPEYILPKNFAEALRLLADTTEAKEKLEAENKELLPQALLLKTYTDTTELKTLGQIGYKLKPYGLGPKKIFAFLRKHNVLTLMGNENYPQHRYTDFFKIEAVLRKWITSTGEEKSKAFDILKVQPNFYKKLAELLVNDGILTLNEFNTIDFNNVPKDEDCYEFSERKVG